MIAMKLFGYEGILYDVHLDVNYKSYGPAVYAIDNIKNYDSGEPLDPSSEAYKSLSAEAINDHKKDVKDTQDYMAAIWAKEAGLKTTSGGRNEENCNN